MGVNVPSSKNKTFEKIVEMGKSTNTAIDAMIKTMAVVINGSP